MYFIICDLTVFKEHKLEKYGIIREGTFEASQYDLNWFITKQLPICIYDKWKKYMLIIDSIPNHIWYKEIYSKDDHVDFYTTNTDDIPEDYYSDDYYWVHIDTTERNTKQIEENIKSISMF